MASDSQSGAAWSKRVQEQICLDVILSRYYIVRHGKIW